MAKSSLKNLFGSTTDTKKLSQSFGPEHRLHYSWEYRRFFNKSEVFRLSECTLFRIPNDRDSFRVGITLKARGSSLDRNRVKRQIRENFRKLSPLLGSYDYNVVIPASKKMAHPFEKKLSKCLELELPRALKR